MIAVTATLCRKLSQGLEAVIGVQSVAVSIDTIRIFRDEDVYEAYYAALGTVH